MLNIKLFLRLHCAMKVYKEHADRVPYILKLITVNRIKEDTLVFFYQILWQFE